MSTPDHCNEVHVIGRLSRPAEERVLPSGDAIVTWRLVVTRPAGGQDTLECTAWSRRVQSSALRWSADDLVEVSGSLHRRFWQTGAGAASRYEISVESAKRVAAAPSTASA